MALNPDNPELQMILDKIDTLDLTIKERFNTQDKYLSMRLDYIENIATKAHSRLEDHKKEITALCEWRHQIIGAMWIIPLILTPITVLLTTWLLKLFGVVK